MADKYVNNVTGNDANSGLTEALAKATIAAALPLAAGDRLRIKATGVDYTVIPTANNQAFGTSFFMSNWVGDGLLRPKIIFDKNNVTANYYNITTFAVISNIDIVQDWGTGIGVSPLAGSSGSSGCDIINCSIRLQRTGAALTTTLFALTMQGSITSNHYNVEYSSDLTARYTLNTTGSSSGKTNYNNCLFHDLFFINQTTGLFQTSSAAYGVTVCDSLFYNMNFWEFSSSSVNLLIGTNCALFKGNTVITNNNVVTTFTTNSHAMINLLANAGANGTYIDNIFYNNTTGYTGNFSMFIAASAFTRAADDNFSTGANAYYSLTESTNITGFSSDIAANIPLSGSPFLSLIPGASGFAMLDSSTSNGLLCIGSSVSDPNKDIGYRQSTGSSAVPNSYDLRSGVTVAGVTGTLVVPAITDVRYAVNYDAAPNAKTGTVVVPTSANTKIGIAVDNAGTGTYDGSDRWTDPGVANVTLAIAYKANSLTNNRTGTNESIDPGVANVVSGTNYKINSASLVGTRTAIYAVLAANLVKIGQDRGDGVVGTYIAAERYSDPGINNVKTGTSYLYNDVTQNGSYTAYPLLALNLVKINQDRGDGQLGTYDAVERYTDLVLSNVKASYNFRYNSLVDNRTGTHVELVSTDPGENNVRDGINYIINDVNKTGSYVAYPLLPADRVQFNYDRGNGTFGSDKGELFNDVLIASDLAIGVSKLNLNETVVGDYTASERYTQLPESSVEADVDYLYNNVLYTGTFQGGGATDYPIEENVLYPTQYAFGTKTGKLGLYSATNINIAAELQANAEIVIQNVLGVDFEKLRYFKDPSLNPFNANQKQWGIRPMEVDQTRDVIGKDTNDIYFEIKLTTDFDNREGDDFEREAELYLLEQMSAIRLQLKETKFGRDPRVRIVRDYRVDECDKIGDRVILSRAVVVVSYRT